MHRNARCLFAFAVLWVLPGLVHAQASVYLAQSSLITNANDGTGNENAYTNARLPWYHVSEAIKGPASATTTYDFSTDGDDVTFLTSFDHTRAGQTGNAAKSYGFFTFVPMIDLRYTLEGSYASTGGGETNLDVYLEEMGTYLFNNVQNSISAGDHSFALGGQDGDQTNELEGSLTGIAYAYSEYILMHRLEIEHALDISNASATGQIRLYLTPAVAIPGDFDDDGDVDMDDFGEFQTCISGPSVPVESGCSPADLDEDEDVDQSDFGLFQRCISGANVPADPDCMD